MDEPAAAGEAFNVANEKPITQFEFVQAMAAAAGKKSANIVRVPRERIAEAGGDSMGQPAYFGVYLDVPPITEVVVKAKRILGFQPTPFETGLRETYRWYLRNTKKSRIDYSFEDRLIEITHFPILVRQGSEVPAWILVELLAELVYSSRGGHY